MYASSLKFNLPFSYANAENQIIILCAISLLIAMRESFTLTMTYAKQFGLGSYNMKMYVTDFKEDEDK